jgi:CRP-like cAMP-binding protein
VGELNRCLAALPAKDFLLLQPHLRTVPLERGTVLHDADDELEHVYFPLSGMVSLVAVMRNGATVETAAVGRQDILGVAAGFGSRRAVGRAIVQIGGDAVRMACAQFQLAARESDAVGHLVVGYNHLLLTRIKQLVACNALHGLQARLCRWLLQTQDCVGSDRIPLTQEQISQMLGVRRTTLTVVARLLQKMDAIHYRRGLIHIVNRAKLEENACECYVEVKRKTDELLESAPSAGQE